MVGTVQASAISDVLDSAKCSGSGIPGLLGTSWTNGQKGEAISVLSSNETSLHRGDLMRIGFFSQRNRRRSLSSKQAGRRVFRRPRPLGLELLEQRTLLSAGPRITGSTPLSPVDLGIAPLESITITFDRPIDYAARRRHVRTGRRGDHRSGQLHRSQRHHGAGRQPVPDLLSAAVPPRRVRICHRPERRRPVRQPDGSRPRRCSRRNAGRLHHPPRRPRRRHHPDHRHNHRQNEHHLRRPRPRHQRRHRDHRRHAQLQVTALDQRRGRDPHRRFGRWNEPERQRRGSCQRGEFDIRGREGERRRDGVWQGVERER